MISEYYPLEQVLLAKGGKNMANSKVHHGGKVGGAAKALASKGSSKSAKSKAGKTLAKHKANYHS